MKRTLASTAAVLFALHAVPASACRTASSYRYLISRVAPAAPPADALVVEISGLGLPLDKLQYTPFRAEVVRVIQGKYDGTSITIVPRDTSNCTIRSEAYPSLKGYVLGTLVQAADGNVVLEALEQRPRKRALELRSAKPLEKSR